MTIRARIFQGYVASCLCTVAAGCYQDPRFRAELQGPSIIDLGALGPLGPLHTIATFRIRNTGRDPLHVGPTKSSCGCASVTVTPPVVMPGEEAVAEADIVLKSGAPTETEISCSFAELSTPIAVSIRAYKRGAFAITWEPELPTLEWSLDSESGKPRATGAISLAALDSRYLPTKDLRIEQARWSDDTITASIEQRGVTSDEKAGFRFSLTPAIGPGTVPPAADGMFVLSVSCRDWKGEFFHPFRIVLPRMLHAEPEIIRLPATGVIPVRVTSTGGRKLDSVLVVEKPVWLEVRGRRVLDDGCIAFDFERSGGQAIPSARAGIVVLADAANVLARLSIPVRY